MAKRYRYSGGDVVAVVVYIDVQAHDAPRPATVQGHQFGDVGTLWARGERLVHSAMLKYSTSLREARSRTHDSPIVQIPYAPPGSPARKSYYWLVARAAPR